jgi:hypothetical protein
VSWHGNLLAVDRVYTREASLAEIISGSPLSPYAFVSPLPDAWEKEQGRAMSVSRLAVEIFFPISFYLTALPRFPSFLTAGSRYCHHVQRDFPCSWRFRSPTHVESALRPGHVAAIAGKIAQHVCQFVVLIIALQSRISPFLLTLLQAELEHEAMPDLVRRRRDPNVRDTCGELLQFIPFCF